MRPPASTTSTPVRMRRMMSSLSCARLATSAPRCDASACDSRICRPSMWHRPAAASQVAPNISTSARLRPVSPNSARVK
jgi:hypothetical protein